MPLVFLGQYRTNELVRWRMHFLSDAIAEIEGLLEVNRDFCKKQMAEKASPALPTNCAVVPLYPLGFGYTFGGEKQGQGAVERLCGRAHLARQCASSGQSSLGALLRERKVTGRDASLPAPLLAASLELVGRGTVGALPQTPQGALPLDPARGNPPLTPSRD